jgi:hypothetical protein
MCTSAVALGWVDRSAIRANARLPNCPQKWSKAQQPGQRSCCDLSSQHAAFSVFWCLSSARLTSKHIILFQPRAAQLESTSAVDRHPSRALACLTASAAPST